ncbi:MAG: hypothetical protein H7282_14765 [Cytophagaceae bacterium]|nr:hypothetical protein [Cytophagaceae bacterium]
MLRASALFIVIVISFLLASITSGIVYYTFYYKIQVANQRLYSKLTHNLNSGIAYALYLPESQSVVEKTIDLYGEENDKVIIRSSVWGVFNMASVSVTDKNVTLSKSFLYGYAPDKESNAAICLSNSDRGLRLSGKTSIVGTCYLPQGVVKTESVDGYLYQGPAKLIDGEIIKSTDTEISVSSSIIKLAEGLLNFNFQASAAETEKEEDVVKDSLIHSFAEPVLYINYNDERLRQLTYLEGNIIVFSNKHINLNKHLKIKDAIVVAPSVRFPDGYQGTLQAICSDSIVVESNVVLDYPSALLLIKKNIANANPKIQLKEKSSLKGIIFAYSKELNDFKVYVDLRKESFVMGQVYSTGSIDCKGVVHGGLICKTILLKTNTSINENYLLNTTIDVKKRSVYYTGSNLLPAKNKKRIIKYL